MEDKRNWRCFFGMHQWSVISSNERHYYKSSTDNRPNRIATLHTLQCMHCGKLNSKEIG